jgi:hypothetical protein
MSSSDFDREFDLEAVIKLIAVEDKELIERLSNE